MMRFLSRVFLPFLLLVYISIETYLKLQHSSLCGNVGCKLAGELLNFDPLYLNYFGIFGVLLLMFFGSLSFKKILFENLFFIALYGAIAFEATIISYQFVTNPEPCLFCLGIFSSLLIIALFSNFKHFAITIATIGAIFIGLQTLAITKNKSFATTDGTYLIQSETCSHCKIVKEYMGKNNIDYTPISTQEASARNFLKFVNIGTIPVLVLKNGVETKLITGDKAILAHFKQQATTKNTVVAPTSSSVSINPLSPEFLSAGGADGGCAITIIEETDCDTNTTKH